MSRRLVSGDFIAAMEEKLEHGREKGRTGWDSHWKNISVDSFGLPQLRAKLHEEVDELLYELYLIETENPLISLQDLRLEAADIANVAMMIADMAGALDDVSTPEPPPVEGDTVTIG